ncbi:hypothetical protein AB0F93_03550 [Micromonospora tulbaghiae]|uniref:hypothetical protein n=1 Tax=Micromonospora tulbaghiae TaxID=479978 RepID=UPI00331DCA94
MTAETAPKKRPREPKKKPTRRGLEIRCSGRSVDLYSFRAVGRPCGRLFTAGTYRSRADWIERARAAGWKVSPLHPDKTVNAHCPKCHGGPNR